MLLCQITDLHIKAGRAPCYGVVDTATMLERCVEKVLSLPQRPDVVLVTGDLVDGGRPDEYGLLRELLAPLAAALPMHLMVGNHDDRDALRAAFPDHDYLAQAAPFVQYAIDAHPLRIVALDSTIPRTSPGELCDTRLAWLDRTLAAAPDRPTVVALHHPPFLTGIGHMDRIGLRSPERLEAVVGRHPQVQRVLSGHLHRDISTRFAGTVASTCLSCAHLVALDLAPDAPDHFVLEPPGFQLHWWNGRTLVTHTAAIGDHPGPYSFRMGGASID